MRFIIIILFFLSVLFSQNISEKLIPSMEKDKTKMQVFPNNFLLEEKKSDDTLWLALFALAFVAIFFMFISSEQMKKIKKMKLKHDKLEEKQNEALSKMGENIHIIAKETINHTHILAEKVKETPLYDDVVKVIYNENALVDVTNDLLQFLRLKSKKVEIEHKVFNFNHVLNEVAGLLNTKYKQNNIELVFDIDKDVPKYMLSDSVHLGKILLNLLEHVIQNSQNKEIEIEVTVTWNKKKKLDLKFKINSDIYIEDKETLFHSYYDEEKKRYVGLGLFVAKELTCLMGGELGIKDRSFDNSILVLILPIEVENHEKRKYRLPDKALVGKKMLIVDRSYRAALASEKLFSYFKTDIDVMNSSTFLENKVNFAAYDIVALSNTLFSEYVIDTLKNLKEEQALKIISLENLFTSEKTPFTSLIDIRLKKPLTQEYVFDTLIELYASKTKSDQKKEGEGRVSLKVYNEAFIDTKNTDLESFHTFQNAHILMVDDDIVKQNIFVEILIKSNIKISLAQNGKEALDFLYKRQERIDMVFIDINMPVMDGYTTTKKIRDNARFDKTAIIALSSLASEHEINKMHESGMNGYLSNPIQLEQLYTALKAFLYQVTPPKSPTHVPRSIFEGLNIEKGIENLNGNIISYKQVLQEFIDAYAKSALVFENLVKEQRYGQVKVLCLEMKGLTSTIGAKEMHTMINEIHQQLIYKKPELLHSYVEKYKIKLDKLIHAIERYLAL